MRSAVVGVVTVVAAAILVTMAPLVSLGVIATLATIALFFTKPKAAAGLAILAILFGATLETVTGISSLGYIDEALVLLSLFCFVAVRTLHGRRIRALPGTRWIVAYVVLGGVSSLANDVPFAVSGQSTFLMLKGFIFAFAVAQLNWTARDVRKLVKPAVWVILFVLVMSVLNLVAPNAWITMFAGDGASARERLFGLPSLIGPFSHPVAYGQFMALSAIAVLAYRASVKKGFGSAILLFGTSIGALLSFRRKAIVAFIAGAVSALLISRRKKLGTALGLVVVTPIALIVGWDSITDVARFTYEEYFSNPEETARVLLYRDSAILAAAAFPLGVGFGRFGSYTASVYYSPEYTDLGYETLWRMGPGDRGGFLSDTFWPAILGEAGFLGLAFFAMGIVVLAWQGLKLVKSSESPYVRWIGVLSVAWYVEFGVESIASPVFTSPPLFALLFGVSGIVVALGAQQRNLGRAVPQHQEVAKITRRVVQQGS